MHRLLKRFGSEGAAAIRHKARGRPSNRRIDPGLREFAVSLVREQFADLGPTLAAEMLEDHHGLKVSRETLRKWMAEDGLWLSRQQHRTFHQPRLRRECFGDLAALVLDMADQIQKMFRARRRELDIEVTKALAGLARQGAEHSAE